MINNSRISVIIPLYNKGAYVTECLNSIFAQTKLPDEIIIVNDCSTDNSLEEIKKVTSQRNNNLPKVIIEDNLVNSGPGISRNRGIELADSEYIMFLDADDRLEHDYIALITEGIEKCSSKLMVSRVLQSKTKRVLPSTRIDKFCDISHPVFYKVTSPLEMLKNEFPFVGGNYIFNKKVFQHITFNNERNFEDWFFCYKLIKECIKHNHAFHIVNKPIYLYTEDDLESISKAGVNHLEQIKVPEFYYALDQDHQLSIRKKLCSIWMFNSVKRLTSFSLKLNFIFKYLHLILINFTLNSYYFGSFIAVFFSRKTLERLIFKFKK